MRLHGGRAIFQFIRQAFNIVRQLARLAQRDKTDAQFPGGQTAKDKAARLHAGHGAQALAEKRVNQAMHGQPQHRRLLDQRGNILKLNARLGEIGDVADTGLQAFH